MVNEKVAICFEAHAKAGNVWAIKFPMGDIDDGQDWQLVPACRICIEVWTVYRGADSPEPRAYLEGHAFGVFNDGTGVQVV